jgi:hypothetical protein
MMEFFECNVLLNAISDGGISGVHYTPEGVVMVEQLTAEEQKARDEYLKRSEDSFKAYLEYKPEPYHGSDKPAKSTEEVE